MTEPKTRTYFAGSVASSRTILFSILTIISGVLAMPELIALIPLEYTPYILTATGAIAVMLRLVTVRPVAFIAPGQVQAVQVKKLEPPAPVLSD